MSQTPAPGRIVHYKLSEDDALAINNRRRDYSRASYDRFDAGVEEATGAQCHIGNGVRAGEWFSAIVVRYWANDLVNLQVFLDGNDTLWVTSVSEGEGERHWQWPPRI